MPRKTYNLNSIDAILAGPTKTRADTVRDKRNAKLQALFKYRRWDLLAEIKLPPGFRYVSPMGNSGFHGYVLREVDPQTKRPIMRDGKEVRCTVGRAILLIANDFGAIVNLPKGFRGRKTPHPASL